MTEYSGRLISADSHVFEPADLWTTRIDRRFRDRAPRIETLKDPLLELGGARGGGLRVKRLICRSSDPV